MPVTRLLLFGASGRMGQAIGEAAAGRDDIAIVDDVPDVFVDFSVPSALAGNLARARAERRAMVIGTTGLNDAHQQAIDAAAVEVPVLHAANMSLGVNLLAHLVRAAAARLGPEWDIEIVEMHHRHKLDAPSGTALLLGQAAAAGRGADLDQVGAAGRSGLALREPGSIGMAALRGGSVAGDHQVIFAGEAERLELGHRAESRLVFARGALAAASWIAGRPAGRYAMADVLGL